MNQTWKTSCPTPKYSGTIVVSFGTVVSQFPKDIVQKFVDAFSLVPTYAVVWKHKHGWTGYSALPSNILLLDWVPQNDLLAHNRTRVFISHCGNNGQFEAVYHAVPMVCFPIFSDQFANSARVLHKRFGAVLDIVKFSPHNLVQVLESLMHNPDCKHNLQKASRIFRGQTPPKVKAAFWINHVIKYGDRHLRSQALEIGWTEYLLLDFILLLVSPVCFCILFIYWTVVGQLCRPTLFSLVIANSRRLLKP